MKYEIHCNVIRILFNIDCCPANLAHTVCFDSFLQAHVQHLYNRFRFWHCIWPSCKPVIILH